ncbi:MAG: alkaline phosphatase family protein, partial [Bacteroidales bacterium]|nr:alkaline phosphatase family protein [Bacteroidales bacterium]
MTYRIKNKAVNFKTIVLLVTAAVFISACGDQNSKVSDEKRNVVLIGIDGMSVSGFQKARTPNLDNLARAGSISLTTRAVMPSVSAPNWASHLMGAGPEQHGITDNGWTMNSHILDPVISDDDGYFPSVFKLVKEQITDAKTALFYDWDALADLYNPKYIDQAIFSKSYLQTFEKALPWIIENNPDFTFIYIGYPDETGHHYNWESTDYIESIEKVDEALGIFINGLKEAGKYQQTNFIVVTDHGGKNSGHGGITMEEMEVPWIVTGPDIRSNFVIDEPNSVTNTGPVIARLLGLPKPLGWTGTVPGTILNTGKSANESSGFVPQPYANIKSGIYDEDMLVSFYVSDPQCEIRYTKDGSDPAKTSTLNQYPALLQRTGVIKAAAFLGDNRSRILNIDFSRVDKIESITLSEMPSQEYPGLGPYTLSDKQLGDADYQQGGWIGYKGKDVEILVTLPEPENVNRIRLGYLNLPASWIFPPREITIEYSMNNSDFYNAGILTSDFIASKSDKGRNFVGLNMKGAQMRYIKLQIKNTGICPSG